MTPLRRLISIQRKPCIKLISMGSHMLFANVGSSVVFAIYNAQLITKRGTNHASEVHDLLLPIFSKRSRDWVDIPTQHWHMCQKTTCELVCDYLIVCLFDAGTAFPHRSRSKDKMTICIVRISRIRWIFSFMVIFVFYEGHCRRVSTCNCLFVILIQVCWKSVCQQKCQY